MTIENIPDIVLLPRNTGFVYGLLASDEPLQIRYVGQTFVSPIERLRSHLSPSGRKYKHGIWFREVENRGAQIVMRLLGEYPLNTLSSAERAWAVFWHEYCGLVSAWLPSGCKRESPRPYAD